MIYNELKFKGFCFVLFLPQSRGDAEFRRANLNCFYLS